MSMYEKLMELPLFKGASSAEISAFLEKTHIEFVNYVAGESVASVGELVERIGFLISGSVLKSNEKTDGSVKISEVLKDNGVIGADNLFGMINTYSADYVALTDCSLMCFDKEQLLKALSTQRLYLLNYLNYLSLQAQRPKDALRKCVNCSVSTLLSVYVKSFTSLNSNQIEISTSIDTLSRLTNLGPAEIRDELKTLRDKGLIEIKPGKICVSSRYDLLAYSGL